ncbi:rhamnosyltransferase WsaF family glycosyltransferase [Ensifer canadensis]
MKKKMNQVQKIFDVASEKIPFLKELKIKKAVSRYFDRAWYLSQHPDVKQSGMDPALHFLRYGWREGRDPSIFFDVSFYLDCNPDVKFSGVNPLYHYISRGWSEGRNPHILFNVNWYLQTNADVKNAGIEPLLHFVAHGAVEVRNPHPLFNAKWYLHNNPDVREAGLNPLTHYLCSGSVQLRSPHPLFDAKWYAEKYAGNDCVSDDPLVDYLTAGGISGRDPNLFFSSAWYLSQHETLRHSSQNPLVDYVMHGQYEGRDPHPDFDSEWYLFNYLDVKAASQNPLEHYLTAGRFEGRSTSEPGPRSEICHVLQIPYEVRHFPQSFEGKDFCLFVTYSANGQIADHVLRYFNALRKCGLSMIAIVVTEGLCAPLPAAIMQSDGLIIRRNHGWDFAAWATALASLPGLWRAKSLILTNDSVYGPTSTQKLKNIVDQFLGGDSDIFALTDSYENRHHMMSYFIGLRNEGLRSPTIQNYWKNVNSYKDKNHVIHQYELSTHDHYLKSNLKTEVAFPSKRYTAGENPTLHQWRDLLARGFPFIKVQALRDTLPGVDVSNWESALKKYPELVDAIERHLKSITSRQISLNPARPIPADLKRYSVPSNLTNDIGAVTAVRPSDATDYVLELPFGFEVAAHELPDRVAVLAHIYYVDLASELMAEFEKIPVAADLFISTDSDEKKRELLHILERYRNGSVTVDVFPNVGRDIAPMLVGFKEVFERYEYFLHVHSKKSPYGSAHEGWREYLLDNILGTEENIRSILYLLKNADTGIVFADHFPGIRNLLNWGYNYPNAKSLLSRAGIKLDSSFVLEFPSSSFFWGRSKALKPLLDLELGWADFPPEEGQFDGTLAHAIERSVLYFCESVGLGWSKVGVAKHVVADRLVPVFSADELGVCAKRTSQALLGNEIRRANYFDKYGEVVPVLGRRDPNEKIRFNLVLPTIKPEETYGGISTALKIFRAICAKMDVDVDFRIIVTHSPVDMHASMNFPDYCVVSPDSPYDHMGKTIVNVFDRRSTRSIGIRAGDIFMTTAWWTDKYAEKILKLQRAFFGISQPKLYFIQDFEVGFYPWSTRFALAGSTYNNLTDGIALINSEELAQFMIGRGTMAEGYVVRYSMNDTLRHAITARPKERILLFYGRPSASRNCFELICMAIASWQRRNPELSTKWRIVSAGEAYDPELAKPIVSAEVQGKLSLNDYARLLSEASVGVSLMISPHPSYPPFEMAAAGLVTVTNDYENKKMSLRSDNFISLDYLDVDVLTDAIEEAVAKAEANIGKTFPLGGIHDLSCDLSDFDPSVVASRLLEITKDRITG